MSETESSGGPDFKGLLILLIAVALGFAAHFAGFSLVAMLCAASVISIALWQVCDPFAEAAQWIGKRYHIPGSVRGATLDAVASSMPELFAGIFFVIVALQAVDPAAIEAGHHGAGAEGYGSAIATTAGSAIYNMILIPACVALVVAAKRPQNPIVTVEKEVLHRDGVWFMVCELVLLAFLWQPVMHWWMGVVFLALYVIYLIWLWRDAGKFRAGKKEAGDAEDWSDLPKHANIFFCVGKVPLNQVTVWLVIAVSTVLAATACYFLVEITVETASLLNIPTFFVAVILAAAVSSVPDTFLSIGAASRGDDSGAVSNAFGSNIFDICICMSIPLFVYSWIDGWKPVSMLGEDGEPIPGILGLRILLWVLTFVTLAVLWHKRALNRPKAIFLIGLYLVFVAYAVLGSLGLVNV